MCPCWPWHSPQRLRPASSSTPLSLPAPSPCPPVAHVWKVWRDDFLWSGVSFMVAASAGAAAALVIDRGRLLGGGAHAGACLSDVSHVSVLRHAARKGKDAHVRSRRLPVGAADGCAAAASGRGRPTGGGTQDGTVAGRGKGTSGRGARRHDPPGGDAHRAPASRAGRARERRARKRAQGSVSGDGLTRTAHPAHRHPRLGGHAAARRLDGATPRPRRPGDLHGRPTAGAAHRRAAGCRSHHGATSCRCS